MLHRLLRLFNRRAPHHAVDLDVRATLCFADDQLRVLIHSGRRTLLDEDGRALVTEPLGRSEVDVSLSDLQRSELCNPLLSQVMGSLNGKTVVGRLYLLEDRVEFLDLGSRDGSQITWSARPGWCELHE